MRQLVREHDEARNLVRRQPLRAPVPDIFGRHACAGLRHDDDHDLILAKLGIHSDCRRLRHTGVFAYDAVELGSRNVFAAAADDIFLARDEVEVAVSIAPHEIARQKPSVTERGCGLLRIAVVALHQRRNFHRKLTHRTLRHIASFIIEYARLSPRSRRIRMHAGFAHRRKLVRTIKWITERARYLCHTKTLDDRGHAKLVFEYVHRFLGKWRAVDDPQLVFGHKLAARPSRQYRADRHDDIDLGRAGISRQSPELRRAESRCDDQGRARRHSARDRIKQCVDVKHRQYA